MTSTTASPNHPRVAAPSEVAHRFRPFGATVFAEMSALAVKHGAVNMGQGFPNFPAPDFLKDAACTAIRDG
ncbi:MAG: aminotransferase, partial [Phycisphaerales bacterium]